MLATKSQTYDTLYLPWLLDNENKKAFGSCAALGAKTRTVTDVGAILTSL